MRRRGAGEGSAPRERADGRWEARYTTVIDGQKVRRSVYADSPTACRKALAEALRAREQGLRPVSAGMTVARYLDEWLQEIVVPHRAERTVAIYRNVIDRHLKPSVGARKLERLASADLVRLLNDLRARDYATRTIALVHQVMHGALAHAVRTRLLSRNVADEVDPPKGKPGKAPTYLTAEEIAQLFACARSSRETTLLALALTLGPRRESLCAMRWRDVDFDAGTIAIPPMKGRTTPLSLPLVPDLARHLASHRARQRLEARANEWTWSEETPLLANERGGKLSGTALYYRFVFWLRRAGVRHVPFHALRHSCATHLLSQGVAFRTIQNILGHASGSSVTDLYQHVMPQVAQEALLGISRLLPEVREEETG